MSEIVKTITIVTSDAAAPGVLDLTRAAELEGVSATVVVVSDPQTATLINDSNNAIYRVGPLSFQTYQALLPQITNTKLHDELYAVLHAFDKIEISRVFQDASIAHPISSVLSKQDTPSEYPVIIKIRNGNQGKGVGLLRNTEDYSNFINEFPNEADYLLQEYIESATAQDKRLFVIGDKIVAAMKRTSAGDDFRANLHTGGTATSYLPTDEEIELAIKAAHAFNLKYAGVDIIDSPRGPLVLEVNPSPGFAISQITNTDIAREVIKGVTND